MKIINGLGSLLIKIYHMMNKYVFSYFKRHNWEDIQSGELIVTSKDAVEFKLGHYRPDEVIVEFKEECIVVPCNPKHHDDLRWEVIHRHCNEHHREEFYLVIYWHVSDVRVIEWVVFF